MGRTGTKKHSDLLQSQLEAQFQTREVQMASGDQTQEKLPCKQCLHKQLPIATGKAAIKAGHPKEQATATLMEEAEEEIIKEKTALRAPETSKAEVAREMEEAEDDQGLKEQMTIDIIRAQMGRVPKAAGIKRFFLKSGFKGLFWFRHLL